MWPRSKSLGSTYARKATVRVIEIIDDGLIKIIDARLHTDCTRSSINIDLCACSPPVVLGDDMIELDGEPIAILRNLAVFATIACTPPVLARP